MNAGSEDAPYAEPTLVESVDLHPLALACLVGLPLLLARAHPAAAGILPFLQVPLVLTHGLGRRPGSRARYLGANLLAIALGTLACAGLLILLRPAPAG